MYFTPIRGWPLGVEKRCSGFPDKQKTLLPDFWGLMSISFFLSVRNHSVYPVWIWPVLDLGHHHLRTLSYWHLGPTLWPITITRKVNIACYFIFIYLLLWCRVLSVFMHSRQVSQSLNFYLWCWCAGSMALCMLTMCSVSEQCSQMPKCETYLSTINISLTSVYCLEMYWIIISYHFLGSLYFIFTWYVS